MSSHLTRAYLFLLLHEFHLCHRHTKHSSRNETLNSHHFLEEKHWKRIETKEKTKKKKLRLTGTPMASGKLSLICACFFDVFKGHPLIQGHPPIPSENCVCYFVFASISLFFYFSSFCLDCFPLALYSVVEDILVKAILACHFKVRLHHAWWTLPFTECQWRTLLVSLLLEPVKNYITPHSPT